jgi:hypothetical protein
LGIADGREFAGEWPVSGDGHPRAKAGKGIKQITHLNASSDAILSAVGF